MGQRSITNQSVEPAPPCYDKVITMIAREAPLPDILGTLQQLWEKQLTGACCRIFSFSTPTPAPIQATQTHPWCRWIVSNQGEPLGLATIDGDRPWLEEELDNLSQPVLDLAKIALTQHQTEQRLEDSAHFIQRVADATPNIFYIYDLSEQRTIYINRTVMTVLGYSPEAIQGMGGATLQNLVHPDDWDRVITHFCRLSEAIENEVFEAEYRLQHADGNWCWLSSRDTVFARNSMGQPQQILGTAQDITHQKQATSELTQQANRERLIGKITQRIHQSLDLAEILNTTVADVRQFLQTDRVIIYRFQPNWHGVVEVEAVGEGWVPLLDMTIKDPCFVATYKNHYQQGRIRAIDDLYSVDLAECHIELLTQFQVRAHLVLPILQADQLWGLLIAHHCSGPRHWQPQEISLLQELAAQTGIAIQQSELYLQVQQLNIELEVQVDERTHLLQQSLDFAEVLKQISDRIRDSLEEHQILQTAVQALVTVLKVDYCCAILYNPDWTAATVHYEFIQNPLGSAVGQQLRVADTPKVHKKLLEGEVFIAYEQTRTQYLWAAETGDLACPNLFPNLAAKLLCPILVETSPGQTNFQALGYLAVIHQTARSFSEAEIKLVRQVANQCAIAVRQARLYQAAQAQVEALETLNRLKDDFLSTVSHELRTPVASMKLAIQMLRMTLKQTEPLDREKAIRYLSILQKECEREISLINDLLNFQQVEAPYQSTGQQQVPLKDWLSQLTQPFREQTEQRQQILKVEVPTDPIAVLLERAAIERILLELLSNACKYSPAGATIQLAVEIEGAGLKFRVCNSGVEIPGSEQSRIFDKFYRIPSTDPWKQAGTGLGLALVQKLVTQLQGTIRVSSEAGQTCFEVEVPILAPTPAELPHLPSQAGT